MKVNGNALRVGNVIEHNGRLWVTVKTQAVKPGKGGAFNQVELKDLRNGSKLNERFRADEQVERVRLDQQKAQFLFRIATIDNPDLNIRIHHGFLDPEEYLSQVRHSKFMPIFNSRMYGGIQSRTIDAVINGSIAFHGSEDVAIDLVDAGGIAIRYSSPADQEFDIAENLSRYPENLDNLNHLLAEKTIF